MDTAFQLRSVSAGDFKGIKQLKQARQDAKGGLKPIVAKLKALVEDMNKKYKGKNKLEPLLELKQYEAVCAALLETDAVRTAADPVLLFLCRLTTTISWTSRRSW